MVEGGLKQFPEDVALRSLKLKINQAQKEYDHQTKMAMKNRISLDLNDSRSDSPSIKGLLKFDRSAHSSLLKGEDSNPMEWKLMEVENKSGSFNSLYTMNGSNCLGDD
eukprot:Protomagalhaensia_wolfi_Nauph_80__3250@NODE_3306_length_831_cov_184_332071_g1859_i3_p1_GENE_NODE_3306_length_831_cov_184_332071_g1859_i3NODE_3306_length_831_cov_184_332071_g1859_i3_p1_ORF_typecomplete_len108_score14_50_NODE_3306_length_831_cov_184_332071_g1859_i3330653